MSYSNTFGIPYAITSMCRNQLMDVLTEGVLDMMQLSKTNLRITMQTLERLQHLLHQTKEPDLDILFYINEIVHFLDEWVDCPIVGRVPGIPM